MVDFAALRQTMVDNQLRTNDVTAHDVLDRFGAVQREIFVPASRAGFAYTDGDIRIHDGENGQDRHLMEPVLFARAVQEAKIKPTDLVLDIGCGTGYSTAILAGFSESVLGVESIPELVTQATSNLMELGIDNAAIVESSLKHGYPKEGPYDVIIMNGSIAESPELLFEQLRDGGRLLAFVGYGNAGNLMLFIKSGKHVSSRPIMNASVPPLPGFEREETFVF